MKKSFLGLFFVLSLIFCQISYGQKGINYLEIHSKVFSISCSMFNVDSLNLTLKRLYKLKNFNIEKGLAEYYYDFGVALQFYGIINHNDKALLISNEYLYKCMQTSSKFKGDAYDYITMNYFILKNCEKAKENLKLYMEYTPEEYWAKDMIEMVNKSCK